MSVFVTISVHCNCGALIHRGTMEHPEQNSGWEIIRAGIQDHFAEHHSIEPKVTIIEPKVTIEESHLGDDEQERRAW